MILSRNVRIVLQARVSSSRLPGKILLPLAGTPLALLCAKRLTRKSHELVVATSNEFTDDALSILLAHNGIKFIRGPLDDVLHRFILATQDLEECDIVVRTTADNPVPDADFIKDLVNFYTASKVDYVSTHSPTSGLPYGLSAEVISVGILREAHKHATSKYEREHVTPWIVRHGNSIRIDRSFWNLPDRSALRCTIDTFNDYKCAQIAFTPFESDPISAPWDKVIESFQSLPDSAKFRVPFKLQDNIPESVVALGTVQLGLPYGINNSHGYPTLEQAMAIIQRALDHGVTWLDTAHAYGESERRIGKALRGRTEKKTKIITKLTPLNELSTDASTTCIKSMVDASIYQSLHLLGTQQLDVLMLHRWKHYEEHDHIIWKQLLEYQEKGSVAELGASIYNIDEAIAALAVPEIRHLQIPFNLLDHRWLDDKFQNALHARPDMRIHVRSVFLQGLLLSDGTNWPQFDQDGLKRLRDIDELIKFLGRDGRVDLCISFVRAHTWVNSVVLGLETIEQLDKDLKLACLPPLNPDEVALVCERLGGAPSRLLDPSQWTTA